MEQHRNGENEPNTPRAEGQLADAASLTAEGKGGELVSDVVGSNGRHFRRKFAADRRNYYRD